MNNPQLLVDTVALLMALRIPAALLCLYKAALSMGGGWNASGIFAGAVGRWMGWAIIFVTLPELLLWFSGLDTSVTQASVSNPWLSTFSSQLTNFVNTLVVKNLALAVGAWFLLRAIVNLAHGDSPIASLLGCFALLSLNSLYTLMESYHEAGNTYATADLVLSLWQFAASKLAPTATGVCLMGIIWSVAHKRPWLHLAGSGFAFLCLFGLWALTKHYLGLA
jgi:hypothetical protein